MKIKIVSTHHTVSQGDDKEFTYTYDVYHGFNRIPLLPFSTEWTLIKSNLTEDELMQYMRPLLILRGSLTIITENPICMRDEYDAVSFDEIRPAADFAKGIEWADSHPVSQWHKVDDGLPPESKECPYWSEDVEVTDGVLVFTGFYGFKMNRWFLHGVGIEYERIFKVTHWQPLPELPKEK